MSDPKNNLKPLVRLRYLIEAALVYTLFGFFWIFPIDIASNMGGVIGRTVTISEKALSPSLDIDFFGAIACLKTLHLVKVLGHLIKDISNNTILFRFFRHTRLHK